jgi:hypothetical protein
MKWDSSALLSPQERTQGADLFLNLSPGLRKLCHRLTMAAPQPDDASRRGEAKHAANQCRRLPTPESGAEKENAVEEEEPDGEESDGPAPDRGVCHG